MLEFLEWDSRFQLRENGEAVSLNESIPSPRLVVDVWTSILPGIMGQDHDDPVKSSVFPQATTLALDLSSECLLPLRFSAASFIYFLAFFACDVDSWDGKSAMYRVNRSYVAETST